MADEQLMHLLEEMRDLQKEHLVHYKMALQNQQEAIARQKQAIGRSKTALIILFVFMGFTIISYFVPIVAWGLSWFIRR